MVAPSALKFESPCFGNAESPSCKGYIERLIECIYNGVGSYTLASFIDFSNTVTILLSFKWNTLLS